MNPRRPFPPAVAIALALVAGCAETPDLGARASVGGTGTYPAILPLDQVLAPPGEDVLQDSDTAALQGRAGALRARGARLAATGTDAETQARLQAALAARGG